MSSARSNALVGLHDLAHLVFDAREIVVGERLAVREIEVVVEAVGDRGADRDLRAREQPGDRLGHHVRGRVPQHLAAVVGVGDDDLQRDVVVERTAQVDPFAVGLRRDRGLGEPLADRRRDLGRRRAPTRTPGSNRPGA